MLHGISATDMSKLYISCRACVTRQLLYGHWHDFYIFYSNFAVLFENVFGQRVSKFGYRIDSLAWPSLKPASIFFQMIRCELQKAFTCFATLCAALGLAELVHP